ncbi:MAG TPA: ABC transporter permease [Chloroflexota bacterium]|nr:ABC transporter permease [Chloroflexota bacterium]
METADSLRSLLTEGKNMARTVSRDSEVNQIEYGGLVELGVPWSRRVVRFVRKNDITVIGAVFLFLVVVGAVFAGQLTPYSPTAPTLHDRLLSPSLAHPFGTDEFGRDLLARILFGARSILFASVSSVLIALIAGTFIGTAGGYWGGKLDVILMRIMDVMLSFPAILLAILIVASLGAGLLNSVFAIAFSMIPVFARLVRSVVLVLARQDYVTAATSLGGSSRWIILKHIFPNMIPPIIVQATAMLAIAISYASALNFIGLGVQPPTPDWGQMISDGERLIFDAPYVPFFPGLAITLTVLSANLVGDGLRDFLDPMLKNR